VKKERLPLQFTNKLAKVDNRPRGKNLPNLVTLSYVRKNLGQSGTDVMIFKIFSPKNSAKKLAFFTENKAIKKIDHNIVF
jgi:hypothetical protein